jgi:hypothetical protein
MHCARVLDIGSKELQNTALSKHFLYRFIKEELTSTTPSVFEDGVSPLVINVILVEVWWYYNLSDASRVTNVFHRDGGPLTLEMVLRADAGTVLEIVATVRP